MKILALLSLITIATVGCKKDDPNVEQQPIADTTKPVPVYVPPSLDLVPPHLRSYIDSLETNKLKDPMTAAAAYLKIPAERTTVPFPPGLQPFTNLQMVDRTDTSATFNFKTKRPDTDGELYLIRAFEGNDTIWIPLHIVPKVATPR